MARGSRKLHYFHPIRMENVVRSALGLVKHLLPVSAGNVLPVVPRLPDIPSFLDDLLTVLGGEAISPASPESPASDASGKAANEAEKAPKESAAALGADAEELREWEGLRHELERRLAHLPPETAAARIEVLHQVLHLIEQNLADSESSANGISERESGRLHRSLEVLREHAGLSRPSDRTVAIFLSFGTACFAFLDFILLPLSVLD